MKTKQRSEAVERKKKKFWRFSLFKPEDDCVSKRRSESPTYQSYQDLLVEDEIDCRQPSIQVEEDGEGFETEAEMTKCLAKAQMEADLDNALHQLEIETRKCFKRRLKKSVSQVSSSSRSATVATSISHCHGSSNCQNSPESLTSFDSTSTSSSSRHHFNKNENEVNINSLSFCGFSNASVDSAISTSHSQSELGCAKEFRLSFVYMKTMAALDEHSRLVEMDKPDPVFYEESLNLSEFSSGTSTFESDCESDYEFPGPPLYIDDSPPPSYFNSTTTVTESYVSVDNYSTLKPVSEHSFLSIKDEKYKKSEFHYANLGSSRPSSFKKSTSIEAHVNKKVGLKRRCLSAPSINLSEKCQKCENCTVLKSALTGLLYDCNELNGILRTMLSMIPPHDNIGDQMSLLKKSITKKETEIEKIMKLVHFE